MKNASTEGKAKNPNNCETCDHKRNPQGGWCYMFKNEPTYVCLARTPRFTAGEILTSLAMLGGRK